jgi:hypothetical protein
MKRMSAGVRQRRNAGSRLATSGVTLLAGGREQSRSLVGVQDIMLLFVGAGRIPAATDVVCRANGGANAALVEI